MQELSTLIHILESFLGESKSGVSDNGQIQFDCPACEDEGEGHFNLEINIIRGKYRCWACEHINGMCGKLSSLIKNYGGDKLLLEYREEIKNIKKSKEYELHFVNEDLLFEEDEELIIKLPEKTYEFKFDGNTKESIPLKYLTDRGMTEYFIKKYDIRYTDSYCKDRSYRNRIILSSFDKFGNLNYYTGRDYTDKSPRKYFNVQNINRKDIIFDEHLINWDGDIVLTEGPMDHLVVPNSIPLLGKAINPDFYIFDCLQNKLTQKVIVFLDNDATGDAKSLCDKLSSLQLCGRLYIVPTEKLRIELNIKKKLDLKKLDPNKLHELFGYKGISWAISRAEEYICR